MLCVWEILHGTVWKLCWLGLGHYMHSHTTYICHCHNASNIDCPEGKVTLELAGVPGPEGPRGEKGA